MLFVTGFCFALTMLLQVIALAKVKGNALGVIVTLAILVGSYYFTYLIGKTGLL